MRNRFFITLLVAAWAFTVAAWAADSNVGTWKANIAKSKYSPGPAPKSQTLTIEAHDGGIKYSAHGENAQGAPTHLEFSAKYDGMDNPTTGSPDNNSIAFKRIDANTVERIGKYRGEPIETVKYAVSADGKTLTFTTTGVNANGQRINNVAVYEKQ